MSMLPTSISHGLGDVAGRTGFAEALEMERV